MKTHYRNLNDKNLNCRDSNMLEIDKCESIPLHLINGRPIYASFSTQLIDLASNTRIG